MAAQQARRVVFVDLARALAAVFMLYGHAIDALLAPQYHTGAWHEAWLFQRGLTSSLFLLLSGFAFSVATTRHWGAQLTLSRPLLRRARRFGTFVLLGYTLHVPVTPVTALVQAPTETWHAFLVVDVLQLIGVTFLGVQVLVLLLRSPRTVTLIAAALVLALPIATPTIWGINWAQYLPDVLAAYLSPATGSQFPVTPWSAFILLGVVLGQLYSRWGASQLGSYTTRVLLAPGLVMVGLWSVLRLTAEKDAPFGPYDFVPTLMLIRAGVCLLILAGIAHVCRHIARLPHVVSALAQETLIVYFVHICIVYGSIWNPGLAHRWGAALGPVEMVVTIVLLIASMIALASVWNRWKHTRPPRIRAVVLAVTVLMMARLLSPY